MKPVPGESKKQNANRIIKATILEHIDGDTLRVKLANGNVEVYLNNNCICRMCIYKK